MSSPVFQRTENEGHRTGGHPSTARVAHDLRNVITAILGTASLLRDTPDLPKDVVFGLAAIEKAALHARDLSMQLDSPGGPVQLPSHSAPESGAESPVSTRFSPEPAARAPIRILAMDDEPGIQALLSAALSHFGYQAVTVSDGAEALREYRKALADRQPYAAVIMDLTIPGGMGGKEAIKALKQIDPKVKAIVSSGASADPAVTEFAEHGFVARVEKPYRIQELGAIIEDTLRKN